MIDAYQATVIAGLGDGAIVHWNPDCLGIGEFPNLEAGEGLGAYDDRVATLAGYDPMIRYSVHECESQNWEDLAYMGLDFDISELAWQDYGESADVDYTQGEERVRDSDGEWHDVSAYVGVYCDTCGERIE